MVRAHLLGAREASTRIGTVRRVIAVVAALKGGVGKTTTAIYLATLALTRDHSVSLIDSDPQASASEWLDTAEDRRLERLELVEAPTERLLTKALSAAEPDDVLVVDTPPGNERMVAKALAKADVVVVPARVGGVEVGRVEAVFEMIPERIPAGLVICSARPHTADYEEALDLWAQAGVPVWGVVPERVAIAAGPEERLSWEGMAAYREVWEHAGLK